MVGPAAPAVGPDGQTGPMVVTVLGGVLLALALGVAVVRYVEKRRRITAARVAALDAEAAAGRAGEPTTER